MSKWKVSYDIGEDNGYETFETEEAAMKFVEMLYQDVEGTDDFDFSVDYWEVVE